MIKTIDLMAQVFHETDNQLKDLEARKASMSTNEYKRERNKIYRQRYKQLNQIKKEHPLEHEVDKYLKEN